MIAVPSVFSVGCVHSRLTGFDCAVLLDDELELDELDVEELDVEELDTDELDVPEEGVAAELPLAPEPSLLPPQPATINAKPSAASAALTDAQC